METWNPAIPGLRGGGGGDLKEQVMKRSTAADKRQTPRPEPVKLSRVEVLKRMRTIPEWRKKTLAEFKQRYPGAFKDQA